MHYFQMRCKITTKIWNTQGFLAKKANLFGFLCYKALLFAQGRECKFGGNPPRRGRGVPKVLQIFYSRFLGLLVKTFAIEEEIEYTYAEYAFVIIKLTSIFTGDNHFAEAIVDFE